MRPENRSRILLAITRSKAKMYEYGLPERAHINMPRDPARLLRLSVGMVGDLSAAICRNETEPADIAEAVASLRFAARYFDAYAASKLAESFKPHLLLLGATAFYLSDLPGSAAVLSERVEPDDLDPEIGGLEVLLWWLLRGNFAKATALKPSAKYHQGVNQASKAAKEFYDLESSGKAVLDATQALRAAAYDHGAPEEILFADACCAVAKRRISYSARYTLPSLSGLTTEEWGPVLKKSGFMRELWPAQRLLGSQSVYKGRSAVVQMPTSAGKSRATELIIRSSFLSGRATLAIIVGPFRALCREIRESLAHAFRGEHVRVDELSDVPQMDFDIQKLISQNSVLVMTPEKLVYILRHNPELAGQIGLLVLDEGHQFDVGIRGVTYELLVTSLRRLVPEAAQKVLISAVISNASDVGQWLNGDDGIVASGADLLPTERSIAFASWATQIGQLHFVTPEDPDQQEFFVPRVIQHQKLKLRPRESKERWFPNMNESQSVALFLGLKVVDNGAVAIFCGRKDTASRLSEMLIDALDRDAKLPLPSTFSDGGEINRISYLYERNLGANSTSARAATLGILSHHGNTPHGIRLATEFAIQSGLARFVLCTSTLAQGVNLPIRYLIVTTARQGGEKIKVRDFHNLMGRAGRSGMHTEGSVLFANPEIYESRNEAGSKWPEFKALLKVSNAEPCASTLLSVLGPIQSDGGRMKLVIDPMTIVNAYIADHEGEAAWITPMAEALSIRGFSVNAIRQQLHDRRKVLAAIESFLMAHWDETGLGAESDLERTAELAKHTLAFHLASSEDRTRLVTLFQTLAKNVADRVDGSERRKLFGKTLRGVSETNFLEAWVSEHVEQILGCATVDELCDILWPRIAAWITNSTFQKVAPADFGRRFVDMWISGQSFAGIHEQMLDLNVKLGHGPKPRKPKVEHVVELGERAMGFDGTQILGAVTEMVVALSPGDYNLPFTLLQVLQKRLKYGLPSVASIALYEAGFADRTLAIGLADLMPDVLDREDVGNALRSRAKEVEDVLQNYPRYFTTVYDRISRS